MWLWLQKPRYLCAPEQAAGLWMSLGPDSETKHEAGPAASSQAGAALWLPWSQWQQIQQLSRQCSHHPARPVVGREPLTSAGARSKHRAAEAAGLQHPFRESSVCKLQLDDSHQTLTKRRPWEGGEIQEQHPLVLKNKTAKVAKEPTFM